MANITFTETQKIVENALRQYNFGGNINGVNVENAWKQSIVVNNKNYPLTNNLQNLRDAIAQSIFDCLTHTLATNNISVGNNSGNAGINRIDGNINLNSATDLQGSARIGDPISINDPVFIAWVNNVSIALNIFSPGAVPVVPQTANGTIENGSSSVKIGG